MKLGARIFFCNFLIFVVCSYYPIAWVLDNLRVRYLEGVEDPLVDQANILASIIGYEIQKVPFNDEKWNRVFDDVYARSLSARIYELEKNNVDMSIYITDKSGKIIFDSENKEKVGEDYKIWRDVRLTLEGKYGARTTKKDPNDKTSSVLYVAAPVTIDGNREGVLTVAKPTTNINNFLEAAKPGIARVGLLSVLVALALSLLATIWITRPINRLKRYAEDIGQGKRVVFPRLDKSEIGDMGHAFKRMQEALEGKKYVEQYVQTLTHEIKSPLSAIRGAGELLEEKMPPEKRVRFLSNIRNEANRIQDIVDRMLELAELENRKILKDVETISFNAIIKTVLESKRPIWLKKKLSVNLKIPQDIMIKGDSFLLNQAIGNLLQNAIDFSFEHGQIELRVGIDNEFLTLIVENEGEGIPDYAKEKIFDKFFSLNRPDTGKKSTGLGLNLVREVAELHGGSIRLLNIANVGVQAVFILPL